MATCSHCGQPAETGWDAAELVQMMADNAYPPSTCGGCWMTVAVAYLDAPCLQVPCPHVVREL